MVEHVLALVEYGVTKHILDVAKHVPVLFQSRMAGHTLVLMVSSVAEHGVESGVANHINASARSDIYWIREIHSKVSMKAIHTQVGQGAQSELLDTRSMIRGATSGLQIC